MVGNGCYPNFNRIGFLSRIYHAVNFKAIWRWVASSQTGRCTGHKKQRYESFPKLQTAQGIMKKISLIFLVTLIGFAPVAHAQGTEETDPGFVLLDVLLYRPLGLAVTLVGASLFIAMSPLTALAAIPEPHDSFEKLSKILVIAPATNTFVRSIGNRKFVVDSPDYLKKPAAPANVAQPQAILPKPLLKPSPPVAPSIPRPMQPSPGAGMHP